MAFEKKNLQVLRLSRRSVNKRDRLRERHSTHSEGTGAGNNLSARQMCVLGENSFTNLNY